MTPKGYAIGMAIAVLTIAVFSPVLALLMTPFVIGYSIKKKPWLGEPPKQRRTRRVHRGGGHRIRIPKIK